MIEISEHARKAMEDDAITEDEVQRCLEHGELEIKQLVKEEVRYGKKLELKDKIIMVIYTHRKEIKRIITCYIIRRKSKWL
tara:strand:+ start:529 stop:771 length:243 start_codon:yes stop_codon:yes gene_type:complete